MTEFFVGILTSLQIFAASVAWEVSDYAQCVHEHSVKYCARFYGDEQ